MVGYRTIGNSRETNHDQNTVVEVGASPRRKRYSGQGHIAFALDKIL